jgi:hypothetical protein
VRGTYQKNLSNIFNYLFATRWKATEKLPQLSYHLLVS